MVRRVLIFAFCVIAPILFLYFLQCDRIRPGCELQVPAGIFVFPFAMLAMILLAVTPLPETGTLWPFYVIAGLQFPGYFAIWYVASMRTRLRRPAWLLVGLHLLGIVVCFFAFAIVIH